MKNSLVIVWDCFVAPLCSAPRNDEREEVAMTITPFLPFFRRVFFLLRKGFFYAYG